MLNYWTKKKDLKIQSVNAKWNSGGWSSVKLFLNNGTEYECRVVEGMLCTCRLTEEDCPDFPLLMLEYDLVDQLGEEVFASQLNSECGLENS